MRTRLLFLCLMWLLGIAAGVFLSFVVLWLALAVVMTWRLVRHSSSKATWVVVGIALFSLGLVWGQSSVLQLAQQATCPDSLPVPGALIARTSVASETATYQLKTTQCVVLVRASALPLFSVGDTVRVNAKKIESLAELAADLPGYAQYLSDNHIQGIISYPSLTLVQPSPWWRGGGYEVVRQSILHTFSEPETSFVLALLLGEQGEIPSRVQDNFQATGLTHILSISGMNISLLTGIILACLWLVPLSGTVRTTLVLSFLWAYISFIGWPISAVRAALFWTLTLLAVRLNRLISLPTAFLFTATVLLSYNPVWLRSISWQLSFGAIVGIGLALFLVRPYLSPAYKLWRIILAPLAPSLGATIITWPILAYHFGTVSTVTLVANLVTEPVVPVLFIFALVAVVVSWFSGGLVLFLTYLVHVCWLWLDAASSFLARVPHAYLQGVPAPPLFILLYYSFFLAGAFVLVRWQKRSWLELWQ